MKYIYSCLLAVAAVLLFFSCNKDDVSNEAILNKKIQDIIPQQYLDSLKKIGLEINAGTTPPNVEGVYSIKPFLLDTSNFDDPYQPGYRFTDALVKLYEQSDKDFGIKLLGRNFLRERDTSIATAISGNGDHFTVYGKVKSTNSVGKYAVFAMLFTGVKGSDGSIKGLKMGIINIDNSNGDASFIPQGAGRIAYDADNTSEKESEEVFSFNREVILNKAGVSLSKSAGAR